MLATLPVNFLLYTAASLTEYETISFDGEKVFTSLMGEKVVISLMGKCEGEKLFTNFGILSSFVKPEIRLKYILTRPVIMCDFANINLNMGPRF